MSGNTILLLCYDIKEENKTVRWPRVRTDHSSQMLKKARANAVQTFSVKTAEFSPSIGELWISSFGLILMKISLELASENVKCSFLFYKSWYIFSPVNSLLWILLLRINLGDLILVFLCLYPSGFFFFFAEVDFKFYQNYIEKFLNLFKLYKSSEYTRMYL